MSREDEEFTFTLTWRVEDFHLCPQQPGEYFSSPIFHVKSFHNTKWCLDLYPKGKAKDSKEFILCHLTRQKVDDGPKEIEIYYKLMGDFLSSELKTCFNPGNSYLFLTLMRNSLKNFHGKAVVIECHMRMCSTSTVDRDNRVISVLSPFLNLDSLTPEISNTISSVAKRELGAIEKKICAFPNQCFARSRFSVDRRSVMCPIMNSICPGSEERQVIPIISFTDAPSLITTFYTSMKDDVDYLEFEISLLNKLELNVLIVCEIELLDSGRKMYNSAKDTHLFKSENSNEIWHFADPFKWSDLKKDEAIILRFKLTFSDNRHFSNIEWTSDAEICNASSPGENTISGASNDMLRLYTEKKMCDVTLRTKYKTFEAHKAVLCARSPVFAAMFESGMKESTSNAVHIDDLDSSTMSQMLHFMYTDSVKKLGFNNAVKLFKAADKYQIESLKSNCRNIIKRNLNTEYICEALSFSDSHNDEELKQSAVELLSIHKNEVLLSTKWRELSEKNIFLANEILLKVCLI